MKQPSEMSNAELNDEISLLINLRATSEYDKFFAVFRRSYTSNIADIFPIMIELGISLTPEKGANWQANQWERYFVIGKDPIRAVCECVLLVLREKE